MYPPALFDAVVRGFAEQIRADQSEAFQVVEPTPDAAPTFNLELLHVDAENILEEDWIAEDDVHGGALPPGLVMAVRRNEIGYFLSRKVYSYSTETEAFRLTRKKPIGLKWIDSDKGDRRAFNIRSRLVCTEMRRKGTDAILSATLPFGEP